MIGNPDTAGWMHLAAFVVLILPMNLLAGGAVIAAVTAMSPGAHAVRLSAWMTGSLPGAAVWTIAAGLPALWIRDRISGSNGPGQGWPLREIAIFLAVAALAHLALVRRPESRRSSAVRSVFALAVTAIGLACALGMSPGAPRFSDPTLLPRFLHMLVAAIAVAGMLVALHGLRAWRFDAAYGDWVMRLGVRWFVIPTAVQMVVGFSLLLSLPGPVRSRFLGGSPVATAEMAIGIALAIAVLFVATHAAHAADPRSLVTFGAALLAATLLAMSLLREQIAAAHPPGDPEILAGPPRAPVEIALVAAVLLIVAAGAGFWMARRVAALPPEAGTPGAGGSKR